MSSIARLFVLGLIFLLAGCSSTPSSKDISKAIENTLLVNGKQVAQVKNLKVNNGYKDQDRYFAEVDYDLEFLMGLDDIAKESSLAQEKSLEDSNISDSAMGNELRMASAMMIEMQAAYYKMFFGDLKKGDSKHLEAKLKLVKSEKGWMILEE